MRRRHRNYHRSSRWPQLRRPRTHIPECRWWLVRWPLTALVLDLLDLPTLHLRRLLHLLPQGTTHQAISATKANIDECRLILHQHMFLLYRRHQRFGRGFHFHFSFASMLNDITEKEDRHGGLKFWKRSIGIACALLFGSPVGRDCRHF